MMVRPHLHVDWPKAVERVAAAKGEWVLVGSDVPASTVLTVKRRENQVLRSAGRIEPLMLDTYGSPPRGDLWLRALDHYKPPRRVGDSRFEKLRLPLSLKRAVFRRAREKEVSVSQLVDAALVRIARRGRLNEDPEAAVIAANVSTKKWNRAQARAERDGFVLAAALREELLYEVRRRRR